MALGQCVPFVQYKYVHKLYVYKFVKVQEEHKREKSRDWTVRC